MATCEKIGEAYLLPIIEALLAGFAFRILGFHADNGSESIDRKVAKMLNELAGEFTKSRPRQCNDDALAETRNGALIRKHLGEAHLPQRFAAEVKAWCARHLNPYVNFHRPCLFAEDITDNKGKNHKALSARLGRHTLREACPPAGRGPIPATGCHTRCLAENRHGDVGCRGGRADESGSAEVASFHQPTIPQRRLMLATWKFSPDPACGFADNSLTKAASEPRRLPWKSQKNRDFSAAPLCPRESPHTHKR